MVEVVMYICGLVVVVFMTMFCSWILDRPFGYSEGIPKKRLSEEDLDKIDQLFKHKDSFLE